MTRPDTDLPVPLFSDIPETGRHLLAHLVEAHDADEGGPNGATSPDPVERLIAGFEAVVEKTIGGGGGNGGGPPVDLHKLSKKNWLVNLLIGAVVAASGAFAAYKATEARSVENEEGVQQNKAAVKRVESDVAEVKLSVDGVGDKIDTAMRVQVQLVDGIEQLKAEAQTDKQKRLEDKVKELERENRRLERNR
jgi:hypothetical protein